MYHGILGGLVTEKKKFKILDHLSKLKADICLLQETHAANSTYTNIKSPEYCHLFSAHFNIKQRGVCILIHHHLQFIHNSTITDPEGRYIIINISINNTPITICSVYGPNVDDPIFFHNMFSLLYNHSNSPIIVAGDFNTVLDPFIDRSSNKNNKTWQFSETIKKFMEDFALGDSWRLQNPTTKQYTYFSSVHRSYSCIDFSLNSNSIMSQISNQQIHPITISDHAPISFTWNLTNYCRHPTRWRYNTSLLSDPNFDSFIKRECTSFVEMNDSPGTSPSLLWQTGKTVLTGRIIAFSVHKSKNEKELEQKLEQEINSLEQTNMNNPNENLEKEIKQLKLKLNEIINKRTNFLIQRLRQDHFQHNNKSGKYLATQIKLNKEKNNNSCN